MNALRDVQNLQIIASMKSKHFFWWPFLLHTYEHTSRYIHIQLAAVNVFTQLLKKPQTLAFTILLLYYYYSKATVQQGLQSYWICLFGLTGLVQKLYHHRAVHYLVTFSTVNTFLWALKWIFFFLSMCMVQFYSLFRCYLRIQSSSRRVWYSMSFFKVLLLHNFKPKH